MGRELGRRVAKSLSDLVRKHPILAAIALGAILSLGGFLFLIDRRVPDGFEALVQPTHDNPDVISGEGGLGDPGASSAPLEPDAFGAGRRDSTSSGDGQPLIVCSEKAKAAGCNQSRPLLADSRIEVVDWEELLEWWPYRPLLRSANPPISPFDEDFHAGSDKGGRKADPESEFANATVWYRRPSSSPASHSLGELLDAGALEVRSIFYPPGYEVPWLGNTVGETKAVVARNRAARMTTLRRGENANVDWRAIRWEETVDNGIIQWVFSSSPAVYSEEKVLRFVNELNETG